MPNNRCKYCGRDLPTKKGLRGKYCIWCDVAYYRKKDEPEKTTVPLKTKRVRYYGLGLYHGK